MLSLVNVFQRSLRFAYITFPDARSCQQCLSVPEHEIRGRKLCLRKVIRHEELKRAEQSERIRLSHEARVKEEAEEEIARKKKLLERELRRNYATEMSLLQAPPPPATPAPSKVNPEIRSVKASGMATWVPLLSNNAPEKSGSLAAGYGKQPTLNQGELIFKRFSLHCCISQLCQGFPFLVKEKSKRLSSPFKNIGPLFFVWLS